MPLSPRNDLSSGSKRTDSQTVSARKATKNGHKSRHTLITSRITLTLSHRRRRTRDERVFPVTTQSRFSFPCDVDMTLLVHKTHFACAANNLSAAVPCRSPLPSFLKAYCTVMGLFIKC